MLTLTAFLLGFTVSCKSTDETKTDPNYKVFTGEPYESLKDKVAGYESLVEGEEIAVIETEKGNIYIRFAKEAAPIGVENFIGLTDKGAYNDLLWHRISKTSSVIQSGDPKGDGTGGESFKGGSFGVESNPKYHFYTGAVGYANSGQDDNKSQFFIVCGNNPEKGSMDGLKRYGFKQEQMDALYEVGGVLNYYGGYTVFAYVVKGMDVVRALMKLPVGENEKPLTDTKVISVKMTTYTEGLF